MASEYQQLVWKNLAGISTKFDPDAIAAGNFLRTCINADGYERFHAFGQVPGTSRQSHHHGGAVRSINFYKYHDLAGVKQREVLTLGNGELNRLETDKTLTKLETGLTNEKLSDFTVNDRIHMASANNDPLKYDGAMVTPWGVVAPGSREMVIESFDDHTIFVAGAGADTVISESTVDWDGATATQIDKTGTTVVWAETNEAYGSTQNILGGSGTLGFYFFVPSGGLRFVAKNSRVLELGMGSGGSGANANYWKWEVGELTEGWNLLLFQLNSGYYLQVGAPDFSIFDWLYIRINLELATSEQAGFIIDKLFQLDEGAPFGAVTGTGAVEGDVSYRVVFRSKYGQLSNAGPPSTTISAGTGSTILLQGIPTSPDEQVTNRYLYRDFDGDALWRFTAEIGDNHTTTYQDNISNAARSTQTPPLLADDLNDNRPPPRMVDVVEWGGYGFGINARNRFIVEIMDFTEYESCPFIYQRLFEEEVIALRRHRQGLVAVTESRFLILEGTNPQNFAFTEVHPEVGASGTLTVVPVHTTQLQWHWDGPYLQDGINPWYLGNHIKDQIDAMDGEVFPDIHSVHDRSRYRLVFFKQETVDGAYTEALVWGYGASAGVVSSYGYGLDPQDLRVGGWSKIVFPAALDPHCSEIVERADGRGRLYIGCEDGFVYWLQDPDAVDWEIGSNPASEQAVSAEISGQWKPFKEAGEAEQDLVADSSGDPCLVHVNGYAAVKSTWEFTVEVAEAPEDPSPRQSVFDLVIGPGYTSVTLPIPPGNRISGKWCAWKATNANKGEGGLISGVVVKYIPESTEGPD
jgi:hypothetical protein